LYIHPFSGDAIAKAEKPTDDGRTRARPKPTMTPDAALTNILSGVSAIDATERVLLPAALGRVAAEDVRSRVRLPAFDNSAMDGFCIHADDLGAPLPLRLRLQGELRAGDLPQARLCPGHAMRIMTGAMVPADAAAVVIDEGAEMAEGMVAINRAVAPGKNIRRVGEDVEEGAVLVGAGALLSARHLALLAAAGISQLAVRRFPRVGIVSTGNELLEPGNRAGNGRIVEVNRFFLKSMLEFAGAEVKDLGIVPDDRDALAGTFTANRDLDLIVTSGGVAGSDADLVAAALAAAGGSSTVCSLELRPGKPIGFGWLDRDEVGLNQSNFINVIDTNKLERDTSGKPLHTFPHPALGRCRTLHLPGNPVAALVTGYLFMLPLVRLLAGLEAHSLPAVAKTAGGFHHVPGKTEFVPVRAVGADENGVPLVEMLGKGGSARLLPLAMADGLVEIPASRACLEAGEFVSFHHFRQMGLA
jgi:molybdopterin molybdotransferase